MNPDKPRLNLKKRLKSIALNGTRPRVFEASPANGVSADHGIEISER